MSIHSNEVIVTAVFGEHAGQLSRTFAPFAEHTDAPLHAFVIGDELPKNRCPEVTYHLRTFDSSFGHPYRDVCYRRWEFLDELDAEYALVVDGTDVLCMQTLPAIEDVLRGASLGACVEHNGSRYIQGQGWTSSYLNGGVTFWNIAASKAMREAILARGRSQFRTLYGDNQMSFNDVVHTRFYDELIILPCQYNYRALLHRKRNWPTVDHLDGVVLYHVGRCIEEARALLPVREKAELSPLAAKAPPQTLLAQTVRRLQNKMRPHIVK